MMADDGTVAIRARPPMGRRQAMQHYTRRRGVGGTISRR